MGHPAALALFKVCGGQESCLQFLYFGERRGLREIGILGYEHSQVPHIEGLDWGCGGEGRVSSNMFKRVAAIGLIFVRMRILGSERIQVVVRLRRSRDFGQRYPTLAGWAKR